MTSLQMNEWVLCVLRGIRRIPHVFRGDSETVRANSELLGHLHQSMAQPFDGPKVHRDALTATTSRSKHNEY